MITIISRLFIKDRLNFTSPRVRKAYGLVCSATGMALNLLLFFCKLAAGSISGSVAVTVDAFHNLTDMGSSAVAFISFLISGQKKSEKFPLGKGRIEYLAGFLIALVLIAAGLGLAKTSVLKIITPEPVTFSLLSVSILLLSVLTKLYMSGFNKKYGKMIDSAALRAASVDCLCDSFSTIIAAAALISARFTDWNVDAFGGLAVSLFIVFAGCKAAKDSVRMLLGVSLDEEYGRVIRQILCAHPEVKESGVPVLHDYGPDKKIVTLDAGFSPELSFSEVSAQSDKIAAQISGALGCETVIRAFPSALP